ncbi:nucleotide disphospho-sugar-binding domain-containing protein [Kitasatospora sp. NPDC101801]|uniref:nucleotide disphospho-sugar-binding domain-containing protein n=1 Tax=Kitasatospora sp. NPDC101801 TaxID=3364103 RepID=UPI0037F2FD6A
MRILLTAAPMYGHVLPLVPISRALRSAGHEVLLAAPGEFAEVAAEAGLPAVATAGPVSMGDLIGFERDGTPADRPADPAGRVHRSGRGFGRLAAHVLDRTIRIAERWRPDLVVSEPTEYAGRLAAGVLDLPWVEHGWGLRLPDGYARAAEQELAPELAALGLPDLPAPRLRLDPCPPRLQLPGPPAGPVRRMRYLPYNGPARVPSWVRLPRERPRVCVTLGSMPPAVRSGLLATVPAALHAAGLETVLATGSDPIDGPLPDSVRAVGWLPLDTVLPACDLVVHHGGPGTAMTALVHGLPQLVLPFHLSDTATYAQRLAELGAGRRLPPERAEAADVAYTVRELLADPAARTAAAGLAAEIAALPTPAELVPVLTALTRKGTPVCVN